MADDDTPSGNFPFGSFGDNNPFGAMPFLGDIMKSLAGQGPLNWDIARQVAYVGLGQGGSNVDPAARIACENLAPLAHRHIVDFLAGADAGEPRIECVTPAQWCHSTLDAYRPVFDNLAAALSQRPAGETLPDAAADPMTSLMSGLMSAMAPMMLGMTVGSMVGQLAARAFGQYDLLLPRGREEPLLIVPGNIDSFAGEWDLPLADIRMWVLVHEFAAHAVLRSAHLRTALFDTVNAYVSAFSPDPDAVIEKLSGTEFDASNPIMAFQQTMSDPALLLGAVISPEQEALRPGLDALLACTVGLVDWIVDGVTQRLLGGAPAVTEALRRRRIESSPSDKFVEHLLGIHHTRETVERGRNFIRGIIERSSAARALDLLNRDDALPTPAEVDAPGLWLARLEIA
ncbi:MAG: zinc-dependent metalloprotease [Actinobacteria bacterium]|nr:zinc-dependent metalloprotease [Actinomycetota bacterium]